MTNQQQIGAEEMRQAGDPGRHLKATDPRIPIRVMLTAVLATLTWALVGAERADASTYTAVECTTSKPGAPDFKFSDPNGEYERLNFCGSIGRQQIRARNRTQGGRYANLFIEAPSGTKIRKAIADVYLYEQEQIRPVLFEKRSGQAQRNLWSGNLSYRTHDSGWVTQDYLGVGLYCSREAPDGCGSWSGGPYGSATLGNARIYTSDTEAPTGSVSSSLFDGKWHRGSGSIAVQGNDRGAGVAEQRLYVNGSEHNYANHCPSARGADGTTNSMAPCTPGLTRTATKSVNLAASPFQQGRNVIRGCTWEFGDGARSSCQNKDVYVDTVAPTEPLNLTVAGGSGWRKDNDFDLRWEAPRQDHAPIRGAYTRVTKSGYDSGWVYRSGAVNKLNDLRVPSPGQYNVQVALSDQAGNVDYSRKATTTIRFDDVPPEESKPEKANGWIGQTELERGYMQEWQQPQTPHPQSGIQGYATAVDQSPSTDPCDVEGKGGSSSACAGAEIDFQGLQNRSTRLVSNHLDEGSNWFHVVPVSGSGVKAAKLEHTELQVDTREPTPVLQGAPDGWSRSRVALTVVTKDDRSGMVDTDDYPDDPPPATSLEVDGEQRSEPDADISTSVAGDGVHSVRYSARDLAGNTSPTQTAEVKIDGTDPIATMERPDDSDPELIAARVSDAVSGIAAAGLQYREGSGEWVALASEITGDRVVARLDSEQMKQGTTYSFRVVATDRAGNTVRNGRTQSGEERTHVGPLRDDVQISELRINGKRKAATVRYKKPAQLSGKLLDEQGNGVPRSEVTVVESYDSGSKRDQRSIAVTTNDKGAFTATLPRGPSRSVTALFAGSPTLLATRAAASPRLVVRGKVGLKVTRKRVRPGKATRFKGRVAKLGANVPAGGKLVEVQVRVRNKWRTVDKALRSNGKGRFNLRYRFGRFYNQPVTFKFRAVVLSESTWPYKAPVKSKRRTVTVVP